MFPRVSFSWCLQALVHSTGVVFMQPAVKVNSAYYCDVLLLKQLLLDICEAASRVRVGPYCCNSSVR